jgi:hypothetical protein
MNEKQNLKMYSDICRGYIGQINQLLDFVESSKKIEKVQINKATEILKKLQDSLPKLQKENTKLKKHINNAVQYQLILKPYQEFLEQTRTEINLLITK